MANWRLINSSNEFEKKVRIWVELNGRPFRLYFIWKILVEKPELFVDRWDKIKAMDWL